MEMKRENKILSNKEKDNIYRTDNYLKIICFYVIMQVEHKE